MSTSIRGPGRECALVLLVGLACAGLAVLATSGGRSWATATITADGLPPRTFAAAAGTVAPWTSASALVALAGLGAVLATAGGWRRVIGLVLVVAGLVVAVGAGLAGTSLEGALRDQAAGSASGVDPAAVSRGVDDASGSAWRWLALAGGLGVSATGVAVVLRGADWPAMGRRYEAPGVSRRPQDEADLWRAQDRGTDPTG